MIRKLLSTIIFILLLQDVFACDICGCSSGNYFIGPFPMFHRHFFGARYTFRNFRSDVANDPSQFSKDFYQTVELWGGWNFAKRWQVLGFVPYNINRQSSDDGLSKSNGIGDITVIVNYNVFNKQSANKMINHQLWIGGGLKIPTGKFSPDPNDIIPTASNQTGTGSVDYLLNALYAINLNKWGINSSVNYKINRKADGYQFGNRFGSSTFVFRSLTSSNTVFNPNVGLIYENLQANKLDGTKVPASGGNALLAAAGLEIGFSKMSIGFNAQLPVTQDFSHGQTTAKLRGMVHLTFVL